MQPGQLNQLIEIHQQAAGEDGLGQPNGSWAKLADEWSAVRHLSGMETIKANAVAALAQVSFRIRLRGTYSTDMRVVHAGVTYNILAIKPDLVRRQHEDLVCEAIP